MTMNIYRFLQCIVVLLACFSHLRTHTLHIWSSCVLLWSAFCVGLTWQGVCLLGLVAQYSVVFWLLLPSHALDIDISAVNLYPLSSFLTILHMGYVRERCFVVVFLEWGVGLYLRSPLELLVNLLSFFSSDFVSHINWASLHHGKWSFKVKP